MKFEVVIWDDRDINSEYPDSLFGNFDTLEQANLELDAMLESDCENHVYRIQIIEH